MNIENQIAELYKPLLRKAKTYYYGDVQSAEDLTSETILKMLSNVDKFEEGTNLNAWGYMILKNNFINKLRKNKNSPFDSNAELSHENLYTMSYENSADSDILESDIVKLIDKLKGIGKETCELLIQGYTYEEIADKTNSPIGTVKSRIFHVRRILSEQINREKEKLTKIYNHKQNLNIMAPLRIDKSSQLAKFFATVFELSNNHWVSVKDKPLTPIMRENGLDHNWGAAINYVFKQSKFFMVEGEKSGMRYRSYNAVIPDFDKLAKEVIDYKESLKDTPKKDLVPKKYKCNITKEQFEAVKTEIIKVRKHFNVDDRCYYLHNSAIREFEVIGVKKNSDGNYYHELMNGDIIISDVLNILLFETPEQLVAQLVRKVVKLRK